MESTNRNSRQIIKYLLVSIVLFTLSTPLYCQTAFKLQILKNAETNKMYIADEMGNRISNSEWERIGYPSTDYNIKDDVLKDKSLVFFTNNGKKWFYADIIGEELINEKNFIGQDQREKAYKMAMEKAQTGKYDDAYKQLIDAHAQRVEIDNIALKKKQEEEIRLAAEKEAKSPVPKQIDNLWGFYEKESGKEIIAPTYTHLIQLSKKFLVSDNNGSTYKLLGPDIKAFTDTTNYEIIPIFQKCYTVSANDKQGVIDSLGQMVIKCDYDFIIPIQIKDDSNLYFYLANDNKWGWASIKQGVLKSCWYDYIGDFENGEAPVLYEGYQGTMGLDGKEKKSIIENLFNLAYDETNQYTPAERIEIYKKVIELDKAYNMSWTSTCYNNIGAIYETAGDRETAYSYYNVAKDLGNETGKSNYRRIRSDKLLEGLQAVANTLTEVSAAYLQPTESTVNQETFNAGNLYYDNTSSSSENTNSTSGRSATYYQTQYNNWERRAKSNYESLTNLGIKYQEKNGDRKGSTGQSLNTGNYTRMQQLLQEAQREMSKLRTQAAKDGFSIQQSTYETATVSY